MTVLRCFARYYYTPSCTAPSTDKRGVGAISMYLMYLFTRRAGRIARKAIASREEFAPTSPFPRKPSPTIIAASRDAITTFFFYDAPSKLRLSGRIRSESECVVTAKLHIRGGIKISTASNKRVHSLPFALSSRSNRRRSWRPVGCSNLVSDAICAT